MDFEKLKQHDAAEWWSINAWLLGHAVAAASRIGGLTSAEIEDSACDAIEVLYRKVGEIESSESGLKAYLAVCAYRAACGRLRKKSGVRSVEGHSDSAEVNLGWETKLAHGGKNAPLVPLAPDEILHRAQLAKLFAELSGRMERDDLELVWEKYVEGLKEREIAEKRGWETNEVGNRIRQACRRIRKVLLSDPRARRLLEELDIDFTE